MFTEEGSCSRRKGKKSRTARRVIRPCAPQFHLIRPVEAGDESRKSARTDKESRVRKKRKLRVLKYGDVECEMLAENANVRECRERGRNTGQTGHAG